MNRTPAFGEGYLSGRRMATDSTTKKMFNPYEIGTKNHADWDDGFERGYFHIGLMCIWRFLFPNKEGSPKAPSSM